MTGSPSAGKDVERHLGVATERCTASSRLAR
ncbi:hypothetical protein JOC37_001392 [Desulfohalotomaculum tongense]|nr:hypothetical protein [Desulforadius tongensis]